MPLHCNQDLRKPQVIPFESVIGLERFSPNLIMRRHRMKGHVPGMAAPSSNLFEPAVGLVSGVSAIVRVPDVRPLV